ncbi:hypothetical protein BCV70DRAFT_232354 [Testicularia cyperi]|uniref:Uncharacterized protein n=1 Tax=Testicularia cyperi TaxID=1882483 RepID=A0A317XQ55_9BASI|nr:hypothetical protein BCV70DRAFT_232354 [Testicularia cyperi]
MHALFELAWNCVNRLQRSSHRARSRTWRGTCKESVTEYICHRWGALWILELADVAPGRHRSAHEIQTIGQMSVIPSVAALTVQCQSPQDGYISPAAVGPCPTASPRSSALPDTTSWLSWRAAQSSVNFWTYLQEWRDPALSEESLVFHCSSAAVVL